MKREVIERIKAFNQGRIEPLLKLKYQLMSGDVRTFYRATCHLFYEDWPEYSSLNNAPSAWSCGDLHLENFGSFKGDNRQVYFDLNDFDEAALAPCTWDLARFLTSSLLVLDSFEINFADAMEITKSALNSYVEALKNEHVYAVETDTATGLVKDLLTRLKSRNREDFLNKRTILKSNSRKIKIDTKRTLPITQEKYKSIAHLIQEIKSFNMTNNFFEVLDIAYRIAGNGSLGIERYVILVEGKGSPNGNYLLDLKAQKNSALQPYLKLKQPQWTSQANRCAAIQKRMQGTPPAILCPIEEGEKSFLLRELQPTQDKVNLKFNKQKVMDIQNHLQTMGKLIAWSQLRSSGRQGSAIADELIDFASQKNWQAEIIEYALSYSRQVRRDFMDFSDSIA